MQKVYSSEQNDVKIKRQLSDFPHILCTFAKFSTGETIVLKIDCIQNNHK